MRVDADVPAGDWVVMLESMKLNIAKGIGSLSTLWMSSDSGVNGRMTLSGKIQGSDIPDAMGFARRFSAARCFSKFSLRGIHGAGGFFGHDDTGSAAFGSSKKTKQLFGIDYTEGDSAKFTIRGLWIFKGTIKSSDN